MGIDRVGVVGGGQMGAGIAEVCAKAGVDVIVHEVNDDLAAQSLQVLGEMYADYQRYPEAERTFRRAAEQFSRAVLSSDWRSAWNKSTLGEVVALQGRYAEAEPILLEGFRILDEDPETRQRTLEDARDRIVRLYEAWGRRADANTWRERELDGR